MNILQEPGIKWGIISAVTYSLGLLILYAFGVEYFIGNYKFYPYLAMLVFAFLAGSQERKINGGYLNFGRAVVIVLTVFAFTEFFAVITEWSVYNVVDPSLHEKVKPITIQKTQEAIQKMTTVLNYADGDIEEILEPIYEADYKFYISSAAQKFVMWLTIDFLFALLLGVILKKQAPIEKEGESEGHKYTN